MPRSSSPTVTAVTLITAFSLLLSPFTTVGAMDSDPIIHSGYGRELMMRGEFEKGLEHLRKAYLLFPLNETLRRNLAEGYAAYGHHFVKLKRYDQADENYVKAMELYPDEGTYALLRGICTYHLKKYDVARFELERARKILPSSAEILFYLGLVMYETDQQQQALELWEQASTLAPGRKEISDILARVRKENAVESRMERGHSSRFDLVYDNGVDSTFALKTLDVLESAANQIGADLGHFPEARIPVTIYTRDDFKNVTASPDWSGGLYDGKIRLPYGSFTAISPAMRATLFHEYAHVIVFDITHGNCPMWLNEGIAEFFGRTQQNRPLPELGKAVRSSHYADFKALEASFSAMNAKEAALAYQQSYAFVNYLVTAYGWHRVKAILTLLGKGQPITEAILTAFNDYGLSYEGLIREWQQNMERGIKSK